MDDLIFKERKKYSLDRIDVLRNRIEGDEYIKKFSDVAIFCAGSYGRLEAHQGSDIDLFFLSNKPELFIYENIDKYISLIYRVADISDDLNFPKINRWFLRVIGIDEMVKNLGGQKDDFYNHFTTRMLLLLESVSLYNKNIYKDALERSINSYFRDYPGREDSFKSIFLFNDIIRYWKTLCLNYENNRNASDGDDNVKHKIKNYKLKYSRLTTCFATILALLSNEEVVNQEKVLKLTYLPPLERLKEISHKNPDLSRYVDDVLIKYYEFLSFISSGENNIKIKFNSKEKRRIIFNEAVSYGNTLYDLLEKISSKKEMIRYLII